MAVHRVAPDKSPYYWTGIGASIGAGIGMLIGLLWSGADGIALGISFGAGIGVALGAGRDALGRQPHERDGEDPTTRV